MGSPMSDEEDHETPFDEMALNNWLKKQLG
jgi:hypothetical protein